MVILIILREGIEEERKGGYCNIFFWFLCTFPFSKYSPSIKPTFFLHNKHKTQLTLGHLKIGIVATTRRLPSDSGAFSDWLASSSSSSRVGAEEYLSLGFNATIPTAAAAGGGMWSTTTTRQINYSQLPPEMGMVGLRDLFVVAPASSFHHHHEPTIISDPHGGAATALGVFPVLTASPYIDQQPQHSNFLQSGGGIGGGSVVATCEECGNQSKKDCSHKRCRTCCKSRGFDCATHVKSTWIPAVRRRERYHLTAATGGPCGSTSSAAKKARLVAASQTTTTTTTTSHTSASNNTPPRSFDTSSSHKGASFKEGLPGKVRAPAVFKCVRVTAVEDGGGGDNEYAYQGVVKIGGHVFKGFLYDHGVEERNGFPNMSQLNLGSGNSGGGGGGGPILNAMDAYSGSGGGLLGVSCYGNQIN
ncbi:protein LATERAL ROOT PRIMORDIUM 1-like [Camellia sinensis]|uniref:protein LATERAL ROOT PRIMORDIUM 1-like n=1 Tax=Camellia sinensis TaxID=4442 RepID=UPI0010364FD8|nr:protein LATERAL ROOT PRIMORDIUM 1-like [Camellia sinensis]